MAKEIIMPKAGMAMEKGVILSWLKEVGEKVAFGEALLEIETDKTTMQVEAMDEGYLLSKLYDAGAEVPVVTVIGFIGEQGETPPEAGAAAPAAQAEAPSEAKPAAPAPAAPSTDGKVLATPAARKLAGEKGVSLGDIQTPDGIVRARDVKITPLAQKMAEAQNIINFADIAGSGVGGKIFSADLAGASKPASSAPKAVGTPTRLSGMRKTIATRMLQSHTEVPPVTLNAEADVTDLAALRARVNEGGNVKISFNDFVLKATAAALAEFPDINVSYTDEGIIQHDDINIGVAVALDDGLIVPVIQDAGRMPIKQLSSAAKALAQKARDGALAPDEYTGGTFTVSNLGMFGITSFTPIINLPEAAILGVCAIQDKLALAKDGTVEARKMMGLSLTFDHRCIDGAGGAKFLMRLVNLLENPIEALM